MGNDLSGFRNLLAELRRRRVFRVAGVYAVVAWLLVQVVATTAPLLHLPRWTPTLVLVLVLVGFPLAMILAWAFELTPEGVRRTERPAGVPGEPPDGQVPGPAAAGRARTAARAALGLGAALVAAGAFAYLARDGRAPDGEDAPTAPVAAPSPPGERAGASIAVLPFVNMSADPENEYFSDGITEDILTQLSGITDLRVISRTSVMTYKGSGKTVPEIAAELGVSHVLEGSVRRAGGRVRITAQLIEAGSDGHQWAESYDRGIEDVFAVQSEIAQAIADALRARLTPEVRARLAAGATASPAAYDLFLKGRQLLNRPGDLDVGKYAPAIAYFRGALREDSAYAAAWAGLSHAFRRHLGLPGGIRRDSALAFARRAVALEPELADARLALAHAYAAYRDDRADAEFERALELDPSNAEALVALARRAHSENRFEDALRRARQALALAPGDALAHATVARVYLALGDLDRAEATYRRTTELFPDYPGPYRQLALIHYLRGDRARSDEAIRTMLANAPGHTGTLHNAAVHAMTWGDWQTALDYLRRWQQANPQVRRPLTEAQALLGQGDRARAAALLDTVEATARGRHEEYGEAEDDGGFTLAFVHMLRGEHEEAIRLLERERRKDPPWLDYWADRFFEFGPLHDDARFRRMVADMRAEIDRIRERASREPWY